MNRRYAFLGFLRGRKTLSFYFDKISDFARQKGSRPSRSSFPSRPQFRPPCSCSWTPLTISAFWRSSTWHSAPAREEVPPSERSDRTFHAPSDARRGYGDACALARRGGHAPPLPPRYVVSGQMGNPNARTEPSHVGELQDAQSSQERPLPTLARGGDGIGRRMPARHYAASQRRRRWRCVSRRDTTSHHLTPVDPRHPRVGTAPVVARRGGCSLARQAGRSARGIPFDPHLLNAVPCTLNAEPSTSHPALCTLHPKP